MPKTITLNTFIKSIEANGLEQAYHGFLRYNEDEKIYAACAIGQAMINLETDYGELYYELEKIGPGMYWQIIDMNDKDHMPFDVIGQELRLRYKDKLNKRLTLRRAVKYNVVKQ